MRVLKMRSASESWQQLRGIIKADPLTTTLRSWQKTHHQPFYGHLAFEANWEGSVNGCFMSWLEIKNTVILKWPFLFYATTMNHFSLWLWCAMKSRFYKIGDNQLNGWTQKKLQSASQSQTCTKKWSLSGGLLPIYPLSFLNPRETITSEEYA